MTFPLSTKRVTYSIAAGLIYLYNHLEINSVISFFSEIHLARGTEVFVKDKDDKLCLYANLMVNFSVSYEVTGNKVGVYS